MHNECLVGLLLRCDEVNRWKSGTSFFQWLRTFQPIPYRFWTHTPSLINLPWQLRFDPLVQLLAVPETVLLTTTYDIESARIFGHGAHITPVWTFRICPECIIRDRLLPKTLNLPQIKCCPQHHLILLKECQCGATLRIFSQVAPPFICHGCRMDWANLPRTLAPRESLDLEQKYLLFYELFFSYGEPDVFHERAKYLINKDLWRKHSGDFYISRFGEYESPPEVVSLAPLVSALIHFGYSPQDISSSNSPRRMGLGSKKLVLLYKKKVMEIFTQNLL
jgi:hypothetical protein